MYYLDIDIPLYNWLKIQSGDLEFSRTELENGTKEKDLESVDSIKESYYKEFGISNEYIRILELYKDIAEAKLDWIIENNDFILNRIRHLEAELKDILERPVEGDVETTLIHLSKWIGYRIDKKETTVREFYKMVKLYTAEAEARKKIDKDGKN
jgi:hypothetical protein